MNKFIPRLLPLTIIALFIGYTVTAQEAPVSVKMHEKVSVAPANPGPPQVELQMLSRKLSLHESAVSSQGKKKTPEIRKSISVMNNILDYMLKERLGEGYQSRSFFSKGTRGYWIPGSGLVFMLGVKFPLVEQETVEIMATEKRKNDLWDRFEMKVDSGGRFDPFQSDDEHDTRKVYKQAFEIQEKQSRFNEEKVDTMRRTILEALAKYGHRFEGFSNDETITVIIEGEGNSFFPRAVSFSTAPGVNGTRIFTPNADTVTTYININSDEPVPLHESSDSEPANVNREQRSARSSSRGSRSSSQITVPQPSSGNRDSRSMEEEESSIERDMKKQESEMQSAHEMLKTREDDLAAAQRELEIVKQQIEQKKKMFESGRISQSDLLDAEKKSIEAQRAFNEAQREMIKLQKQLETAQIQYDSLKARKDALSRAEQELNQFSDQQRLQSLIKETIQVNNWSPFSDQTSPAVMVVQIKFGDLPKEEGAVEDIENKVKITRY